MFAQRLNFLMELTSTQASALGRACSLDASHISRLRNGSRPLPKNPGFLPAMCLYLARRIRADYQKSVMCETMKLASWPLNETQGAKLVEQLLLGSSERTADVGVIISGFTSDNRQGNVHDDAGTALSRPQRFYYGSQGKREAVLQFFDLVLHENSPQTLLLSSEEEMSWLYDDPDYAVRWSSAFTRVLRAGNRVRIIHKLGRSLYELIEAVAKWLPVYMSGMIEPYYYPKLRDDVTQRTLFIAPRTAAVVSSSVMQKTEGMLNELVTDKQAVSALSLEYDNYLSLCRPLVRIITEQQSDELWQIWGALAGAEGDLVCMSGMPTLATMPESVARAMQARAPQSRLLELRNSSAANLEKLLEHNCYTELLAAADGEPDEPNLPCAEYMGAHDLRYTADELAAHRDNVRLMAEKNENFTVLEQRDIPRNLLLYVKEGRGVIMVKTDAPCVSFIISESSLSNAFWDYLTVKANLTR